ncbi:MAG: hypothetical protein PHG24_01170, partial [Candidatus Pacebacteria bacterium]|nr:hypothetical protein [Candidatus Paceibacterota bacterium]
GAEGEKVPGVTELPIGAGEVFEDVESSIEAEDKKIPELPKKPLKKKGIFERIKEAFATKEVSGKMKE